jgi:DMSO/TMAO reductase YedYZ molybdopterin-dependent catalytic subunit
LAESPNRVTGSSLAGAFTGNRFPATHILSMAEAKDILLATHIGEAVLDHAHGFPLRAVAPSRRGWFWVKRLRKIEVSGL